MRRSSLLLSMFLIMMALTSGCGRYKLQLDGDEAAEIMDLEPLVFDESGVKLGPKTESRSIFEKFKQNKQNSLAYPSYPSYPTSPSGNASRPAVLELVSQAIAAKGDSPYFVFTAMGVGLISQGTGCVFVKVKWKETEGGSLQTATFTPPNQQPNCQMNYLSQKKEQAKTGKGAAGGYLVVGAKLPNETYAGVAGVGVLAVSDSKLTGCGAGAAGITSSELDLSHGKAGAVCGSVQTTGAMPIP